MEAFKNYYRALDVDFAADDATIKAAFRRLARRHHPDLAKNARAARRFPEIREAYEVLSDPERRRRYDQAYRAQTALQPVKRDVKAARPVRDGAGFAGLGISVDLMGLRLNLALGAAARRGPARKLPRRSEGKKRSG